jgi:hypothetical protein
MPVHHVPITTSAGAGGGSVSTSPNASGQMMNNNTSGQILNTSGQMLNSSGQMLNSSGQMLNSSGQTSPTSGGAGQILTNSGQILTGQNMAAVGAVEQKLAGSDGFLHARADHDLRSNNNNNNNNLYAEGPRDPAGMVPGGGGDSTGQYTEEPGIGSAPYVPVMRAVGVASCCMSLEIVEARNLARLDGTVATQPYAAVSLVANAHTLQQQHYLLIDHRYVCVCMYVCMCMYIYVYIYIYIYKMGVRLCV